MIRQSWHLRDILRWPQTVPNAYDSYANFLMKLKRYDESIQQYTKAYDLNPDKIITVARIGQNYAFRGEYAEARSYYQKYYDRLIIQDKSNLP